MSASGCDFPDFDAAPKTESEGVSDRVLTEHKQATVEEESCLSLSAENEESVGKEVVEVPTSEPESADIQRGEDQPSLITTSTTSSSSNGAPHDDDVDVISDDEDSDAVPSNEICVGNREGETELIKAARLNHHARIRQLVRSGLDCNALCKWEGPACMLRVEREGFRKQLQMMGYAALHVSVIHSSLRTIKCLLSLGADVNIRDKNERTPLQLVAAVNRPKVAHLLINAGAEINTHSVSGRCPLMEAVTNFSLDLSRMLLRAGADANLTDIKGTTPLTAVLSAMGGWAISGRSSETATAIVKSLIDAGCEVDRRNRAGATALMLASGMKINSIIPVLIAAGANVNLADRAGRTSFSMAIEGLRNLSAIKELMKHGAATHVPDNKGQTPLSKVLKYGAVALLRLLLSTDAVPHTYDILTAPRILQLRQFLPEFDAWLLQEFHEPRSLMRLSREVIRHQMSPHNLPQVRSLGLPQSLNDFVLGATD